MRLALTHGIFLEPENWTFFKKIRPSAFIPTLPVSWPVRVPDSTTAVQPITRQPRALSIDALFIRWMRVALIGALVALWSLAGWVIVDALQRIFS
ncbi:MAG: hypothetical protein HQL86_04245 [Magnetococcales bacterium]|nr:hypothetical protein [Magnetococcales bacterium]